MIVTANVTLKVWDGAEWAAHAHEVHMGISTGNSMLAELVGKSVVHDASATAIELCSFLLASQGDCDPVDKDELVDRFKKYHIRETSEWWGIGKSLLHFHYCRKSNCVRVGTQERHPTTPGWLGPSPEPRQ